MIGRRDQMPRYKSDFYRDNYRKILRALVLALIVIGLLVAVIIYMVLLNPKPQYYASTVEGRIIPLVQQE
jgi:intracellular multiplication protein IcmL